MNCVEDSSWHVEITTGGICFWRSNSLGCATDFHDSRERRRKNLELNLNLKQGFVEAELNPLEGDYTEAALMARSLVEEFNNIVLHEAHTKVSRTYILSVDIMSIDFWSDKLAKIIVTMGQLVYGSWRSWGFGLLADQYADGSKDIQGWESWCAVGNCKESCEATAYSGKDSCSPTPSCYKR